MTAIDTTAAPARIVYPHVVVDAPPSAVFDFLVDLRNMPAWSIHFCQAIRVEGDGAWVRSPQGEVYFAVRADARTGVVDWVSGPTRECATCWPTRVAALPNGASLYTVTALLRAEDDAAECERLFADELGMLKRLVEERATRR
jgi:hypothetical protein